jgi:hypothetical protein
MEMTSWWPHRDAAFLPHAHMSSTVWYAGSNTSRVTCAARSSGIPHALQIGRVCSTIAAVSPRRDAALYRSG